MTISISKCFSAHSNATIAKHWNGFHALESNFLKHTTFKRTTLIKCGSMCVLLNSELLFFLIISNLCIQNSKDFCSLDLTMLNDARLAYLICTW